MARIGSNPAKRRRIVADTYYHRVAVPIHIPNLADPYFKNALEILEISLATLVKTVHEKTRISIILDASCGEVVSFIRNFALSHSVIDQVFESSRKIGKVNALQSVIKSNSETLITLADADVLFIPGWQGEVEKVFKSVPVAGMVSPARVTGERFWLSELASSTIWYGLINGFLRFEGLDGTDGFSVDESSQSQGDKVGCQDSSRTQSLTIHQRGCRAVVGCSHFVVTVRAEIFEYSPNIPCALGFNGAELPFYDNPNNDNGFLRLSTYRNFAFHMGNRTEEWMYEELSRICQSPFEEKPVESTALDNSAKMRKPSVFLGKVLNRLLKKFKFFRKTLLTISKSKAYLKIDTA